MEKFPLTATAVMAACALMLIGGAGTAAAQEPLASARRSR